MVKLLLLESGTVRAFKLGDGVLRVGSGEMASLRAQSADVAALHFDLEIRGESALVRPLAGVLPPTINAVPVIEPQRIGLRQALRVGALTLWLDSDDSSSIQPPPDASSAKAHKGPTNLKGQFPPRAKGPKKNKQANYRGKGRVVESQRRSVERGLPNGIIVGGVLLLLALGFMVVRNRIAKANKQAIFSVSKMLDTVEQKLLTTTVDEAEAELARILPTYERSAEDEARLLAIRKQLLDLRVLQNETQANLAGTKYLDVYLKRYASKTLDGDPSDASIRLFLMRVEEFKQRWPRHKDMAWVDRMQARFRGTVDISKPPTYEDIVWEIKYIDVGENRNFKRAFALIEDLRTRLAAGEMDKLERLEQRTVNARNEHFQERMDKVEDVLKFFDSVAKPVGWLLHLVLWCGDEGLADKAAHKLISIERADACLRGYELAEPELYRQILAHPVIAEYARRQGLLN